MAIIDGVEETRKRVSGVSRADNSCSFVTDYRSGSVIFASKSWKNLLPTGYFAVKLQH